MLYDDPAVYDILTSPGTAAEVDALDRIARRWVRTEARRKTWLEPACGSGRYLRVVAGRGHRVVGFDRSSRMIEYARRRLPATRGAARVFVADMTRFAHEVGAGRIDLAFNLMNTIRHLESDDEMLAHFAEMAHVLEPGGVYVVGSSLTEYGAEQPDEDLWEGKRGRCGVRQLVQYLPPAGRGERQRFEQVISHLAIERPSGTAHVDSRYALRCYDAAQWRKLVSRSELRLAGTTDLHGRPMAARVLPYALDLLMRRA
jgi:SAM-dependent methyltransferase